MHTDCLSFRVQSYKPELNCFPVTWTESHIRIELPEIPTIARYVLRPTYSVKLNWLVSGYVMALRAGEMRTGRSLSLRKLDKDSTKKQVGDWQVGGTRTYSRPVTNNLHRRK